MHRRSRLLGLLVNLPVLSAVLGVTLVLLVGARSVPYLEYEVYSVLFALLILNLATHPKLAGVLERQPLHYLGKISYGLYLLHPIAIVASIRLLAGQGWMADSILYPLCLFGTVGLAALSYRFVEAPFLRLKPRFAVVSSGDNARGVSAEPGRS